MDTQKTMQLPKSIVCKPSSLKMVPEARDSLLHKERTRMDRKLVRTGLQPALALSFLIVGLTGVLLLLHLDFRGLKHLHQWMSLVFLLCCSVHLFLNWRGLRAHLHNGPVVVSAVGIGLLSLLLLFSAGGKGNDGHHYGHDDHFGGGHHRFINAPR